MIRRELSEAQLDAMAAPDERTLVQMLELHRDLYRADLWGVMRMSTETPPVFVDSDGSRHADEMSRLGPTLSYPLTSYITGAYGRMFPWARAARAMRDDCRRHHPEHQEREEFRGSLCSTLTSLTVEGDYILFRACLELGVSPERAALVLRRALRYVESHMEWQRQKAEQRAVADRGRAEWPGTPGFFHSALPGLHAQDCPNLRCRGIRRLTA